MIDFKSNLKEEIKKTTSYDKPFIVTFSGLPECGKTEIARELSKDLKIYLLSNDYVRNYFYQFTTNYSEENRIKIEEQVKKINLYRIKKLLLTGTSFVYDKDFNTAEQFKFLQIARRIRNMDLIKIKVNSNDSDNLKRVASRVMDYDKIYNGVIGDNVEYLSSYPEEVYYQIKNRKPQILPDEFFDYSVDRENLDTKTLEKRILFNRQRK